VIAVKRFTVTELAIQTEIGQNVLPNLVSLLEKIGVVDVQSFAKNWLDLDRC
jgi:hypothetical protein